tara:strand:- start:1636 stop:1935 length:300 start_codon:yes stop_codon:yes gene_type:complete
LASLCRSLSSSASTNRQSVVRALTSEFSNTALPILVVEAGPRDTGFAIVELLKVRNACDLVDPVAKPNPKNHYVRIMPLPKHEARYPFEPLKLADGAWA